MGKKEIDNLITIHKADGVLLTNSYGTYRIMQKDIGLLKLNSGQIMLADPLVKYRPRILPAEHWQLLWNQDSILWRSIWQTAATIISQPLPASDFVTTPQRLLCLQ